MTDLSAIAGRPVRVFEHDGRFGIEIDNEHPTGRGYMGDARFIRWSAPSLGDAAVAIAGMKARGDI